MMLHGGKYHIIEIALTNVVHSNIHSSEINNRYVTQVQV